MILNCPVTSDDVERANTIYGPSITTLKRKSTRTKSKPVVTDYVDIPPAVLDSNKVITLSADILFVNRIPFYATIIRHIKFTTVEAIPSWKLPQLIKPTQYVLDLYSQRGFKITTTLMDGEFIPMHRKFTAMGVYLTLQLQMSTCMKLKGKSVSSRNTHEPVVIPFRLITSHASSSLR